MTTPMTTEAELRTAAIDRLIAAGVRNVTLAREASLQNPRPCTPTTTIYDEAQKSGAKGNWEFSGEFVDRTSGVREAGEGDFLF